MPLAIMEHQKARVMMELKNIKEIGAYVLVSLASVGGAAFLSLQFLNPVSSQENVTPNSEEAVEDFSDRPSFPVIPGTAEDTIDSARELEVFLEPFIYESGTRRDPFEPFVEKSAEQGVALSPLQKFGLHELKLIGIMWDIKSPKAMFVDPTQLVHVVGRDEGIGRKNGYIAAIREGEVVIVEAEKSEAGIVYETKVLRLPR